MSEFKIENTLASTDQSFAPDGSKVPILGAWDTRFNSMDMVSMEIIVESLEKQNLVKHPKLNEWVELTDIQQSADDHQLCPICHEQIRFCDCPQNLAHEILQDMIRNSIYSEEHKRKIERK